MNKIYTTDDFRNRIRINALHPATMRIEKAGGETIMLMMGTKM
jgi:hypothetical protein